MQCTTQARTAAHQMLLNSIFSLALSEVLARVNGYDRKRDPRRVLPLVSRGFLAATSDAEGLWRHVQLNLLTLSAERAPLFVRWLDSHAPAIRTLVLYGRPLPAVEAALRGQLAALAAAVQAAGGAFLQRLELPRSLGAAVLARLDPLRMPHLTSLAVDLAASSRVERGDEGGGGGGSVQERRPALAAGQPSEADAAMLALLRLPALSELLVQSSLEVRLLAAHPAGPWPLLRRLHFADVRDVPRAPGLAPLASLASLSHLRFYQRDGLRLPGPLTALSCLAHLHAAVRYQDDPCVVEAQLSKMTSLQALWLQHAVVEAPASLAALPRLHTLALVGSVPGWAQVLQGFAPPERPRAERGAAAAAAAAAEGCAGVSGADLGTTQHGSHAWGEPPLARCQLRALHLEAHAQSVSEVPAAAWAALAALGPGLTRLELPYNRLRQLPGGAYLDELRVLDLSQNSLDGVPPALLGCPHLSALSLGQQEASSLGESAADVATLRALPALRLLVVSSGHYSLSYLAAGLRSPAEAAHLGRVREGLPRHVAVDNRQGDWERATGRLASLFEVSLRR